MRISSSFFLQDREFDKEPSEEFELKSESTEVQPRRSDRKELTGRFRKDWGIGRVCFRAARRGMIDKGTPALLEFRELWESDGWDISRGYSTVIVEIMRILGEFYFVFRIQK